ncbi:hypothetical protein, partial [Actinomadura sp. NBRC 104425]|uniref:hypothetical protein n=1 Tax=Actinomadura sp. NBRC 104425 TaxID=3032204 RepID=UPI002554BCC8
PPTGRKKPSGPSPDDEHHIAQTSEDCALAVLSTWMPNAHTAYELEVAAGRRLKDPRQISTPHKREISRFRDPAGNPGDTDQATP